MRARRRSDLQALGLAAVSGPLYAAAQPGCGWWPLAPICLVPLLLALRGRRWPVRFGLAWLAGTIAGATTAGPTLAAAGERFFALSAPSTALLVAAATQIYGALPIAVFGTLCGDPGREPAGLWTWRVAASWTACELARSSFATGVPWGLLAHSLAAVPGLIQLASIGGIFLVGFALALANASLAGLALPRARPRAALTLAAVAGAAALAAAALPQSSLRVDERATVRLVQPNLPVSSRLLRSGWSQELSGLRDLTLAGRRSVDLAIWPENAVGLPLPANTGPLERRVADLEGTVSHLIVGAPWIDSDREGRFRNSAALLEPGRGLIARYDKRRLVPFAEYTPQPFALLLGNRGLYVAGHGPALLHAGPAVVAPLICFEVSYPDLARQSVLEGATLLVNLSNDAWLDGTAGPDQHLAAAVFRAVETRRSVVRSTNTGVTAAIDPWGRVLARLPAHEAAFLDVDVPLIRERTLYSRLGDWPVIALCALPIVSVFRRRLDARKRPGIGSAL